uniref:Uncharacterized protein n=1 Tax=Chaetoceros debilis TaxID=122233 RepID=A0A7S3QJA8_9STRA|mmetsp:Transcript_19317/g.29251  ORF Transcript_19317/g.29251 Transcript_19317/m.29251 type:complete len:374 (+) Transcript_19317:63-1184(+)
MSCEQQKNHHENVKPCHQESGGTRSIEFDDDSSVGAEHRGDQESRDPPSPLRIRCSSQYRSKDIGNLPLVGDSASTSKPKPKATTAPKTKLKSGRSPPKLVENNVFFTFRFLCIATILIVLRALVRQNSKLATLRNHVGDLNYALLNTSAPKDGDGDVKYLLEEIEYLEENTARLEEKVLELNHRALALENKPTEVSYDANVVRYVLDEVEQQEEHTVHLGERFQQTKQLLTFVKYMVQHYQSKSQGKGEISHFYKSDDKMKERQVEVELEYVKSESKDDGDDEEDYSYLKYQGVVQQTKAVSVELNEVKAENEMIKHRLEIVMKDNAYLQSKHRDQKISMENMQANSEAILLALLRSNNENIVLKEAINYTY